VHDIVHMHMIDTAGKTWHSRRIAAQAAAAQAAIWQRSVHLLQADKLRSRRRLSVEEPPTAIRSGMPSHQNHSRWSAAACGAALAAHALRRRKLLCTKGNEGNDQLASSKRHP